MVLRRRIKRRTFPIWAVEDAEGNGMTEKDVLRTFQKGVNSGQVWRLQGWYGRTASDLLQRGLIKYPTKKTTDFYGNPIPVRRRKR